MAERPLEHVPRVGVGRAAVRHQDVAEHPADPGLAAPGQHLERGRVRLGDHVRLVDPGEALDRRPVEADPLRERALQLGRGDRHRLEEAEHVGEPQPDETDVALLEGPEHELFLPVHDCLSSQVPGADRGSRGHTVPRHQATVSPSLPPPVFPAGYMTARPAGRRWPVASAARRSGGASSADRKDSAAEVVGVDYRFRLAPSTTDRRTALRRRRFPAPGAGAGCPAVLGDRVHPASGPPLAGAGRPRKQRPSPRRAIPTSNGAPIRGQGPIAQVRPGPGRGTAPRGPHRLSTCPGCGSPSPRSTPTVGDLDGNAAAIIDWTRRAADRGARLVVFPEMMLTGYPVEDLALRAIVRRRLGRGSAATAARLADRGSAASRSSPATWTADAGPHRARPARRGPRERGGAAARRPGAGHLRPSTTCPTTACSTSTATSCPATGCRCSASRARSPGRRSRRRRGGRHLRGPVAGRRPGGGHPAGGGGAAGRPQRLAVRARTRTTRGWSCACAAHARRAPPLAYVNMVGGQDELVFDGDSIVVDAERPAARPRPAVRRGAARRGPRPAGGRPGARRRTRPPTPATAPR